MTISPGTKLGPYEIVGLLGAGGMGEVYRAKDTRLERAVAVKMVSRSFANDTDRLRRFELEARTVAALNHPNILGIHDIGSYEGAPYLVSELLEGETLREKLEAGALGVRRATEYALGIARGLATAHEKGIVHRDLKPENVFIARDGQVKILDFGLAKLMRSDAGVDSTLLTNQVETRPGMVLGTMGYISPEQVRCEACDARSDIFSLGAVLYEMLTGKRAFKRETAAETMTAILREEPPELSETGCQVPPGMQRIIARCLEKSVERRFQSASDLGFAIESLSGTGATQSLERVKEKRAWCPSAAAAAGVLGVAGLAGLVAARWPREAMPRFTRLTYHQGYPTNARFAKEDRKSTRLNSSHRLVGQRAAAGFLGEGRVSTIVESGLAERGVARGFLGWGPGAGAGPQVSREFPERNAGSGADGGRFAPRTGETGGFGGLCAGRKHAGIRAACERKSKSGVSARKGDLRNERIRGLRASRAFGANGGVRGSPGVRR